jgi:hypothetical protein
VVAKREKGIEEIMDRVGRAERVSLGTDVLTIDHSSELSLINCGHITP